MQLKSIHQFRSILLTDIDYNKQMVPRVCDGYVSPFVKGLWTVHY